MEHTPRTAHRAVPAAALAAVLGLAACSAGASGGTPQTSPHSSASTAKGGPADGGGNPASGPAASGEIAQITGHTLQVQSTTDQTAVTYSARTRFTTEKRTTLASVKVGTCIVATAPGSSSGASHANITATSVRISQPTGGGCGPRAVSPVGPSGAPPSGFPSGELRSGAIHQGSVPSGAPGGKVTPGAVVAGSVTAVHGSTITVKTATPSGTSSTGTVRVTAATKFITTVPTTHAALKVGLCAVVNGSTNSSGAVSATRIALSPKTNGSCTATLVRSGPNG